MIDYKPRHDVKCDCLKPQQNNNTTEISNENKNKLTGTF